jgi:WD40 repeat protein
MTFLLSFFPLRSQTEGGLFLVSSSYDQTAKIWSAMDFTLVRTLSGHESKVMRADIAPSTSFCASLFSSSLLDLFPILVVLFSLFQILGTLPRLVTTKHGRFMPQKMDRWTTTMMRK